MSAINGGLRQCTRCFDFKPNGGFAPHKTGRGGLSPYCRVCVTKMGAPSKSALAASRKATVISHYSRGTLACARCRFTDIRALTLDHIDGGGTRQRRETNVFGDVLYKSLIRAGFPAGYQVLCMNCQFVKRHENREWRKSK